MAKKKMTLANPVKLVELQSLTDEQVAKLLVDELARRGELPDQTNVKR